MGNEMHTIKSKVISKLLMVIEKYRQPHAVTCGMHVYLCIHTLHDFRCSAGQRVDWRNQAQKNQTNILKQLNVKS